MVPVSEGNYKGVWILAEQRQGELQEVSLELVCWGRKLADRFDEELSALLFGDNAARLAPDLSRYGADKVYVINDQPLTGYPPEAYTEALSTLATKQTPGVILFGATIFGRDLASRLAAQLKTGLASDCTALEVGDDGLLSAVRPVYGGQLDATVISPVARPQIATVRPGIIDAKPAKSEGKAEIITVEPQPVTTHSRTTGFIKADPKTIRLDEAEVIIAGGGGIDSQESFQLLQELAELLGGCVGASRVPVDKGWVPLEKQIGQTGMTAAPKLYIAFGISGSIYHTMGMKDSKVIVVINNDRNAPFFKLADMGIVGDYHEMMDALIPRLREIAVEQKNDREV
jgi:electron transfer flavoprotein alpha subunit